MNLLSVRKLSVRKLLLAGAGHTHIGLLRRLSSKRFETLSNVDIILISDQPQTVYSGMLPGWLAEHYQLNDISIDVKSLCLGAGVHFIQRSIVKVDAASRKVTTTDDEHYGFGLNYVYDYDVLSLNTGADTDMRWLHNNASHTVSDVIPIRPLSKFIEHWQQILNDAQQSAQYRLAIVGAGAAATELVMAAQVALQRINPNHQVYLVCGELLLSGFNQRFRRLVINQLQRHGIVVINARATEYSNGQLLTSRDLLKNSLQEPLHYWPMDSVIAATGVIGAQWTQQTDLETANSETKAPKTKKLGVSDNGFITVNAMQQSISHPNVFAVGDVATRIDQDVAHSGVHAVHGGAVEADNLLAYLQDESMQKYQPSTRTLYLLSCGDKYAIGSWGKYSLQGRWVWYLKKYIDKRFVNSYKE